jgi:hypothetical protein
MLNHLPALAPVEKRTEGLKIKLKRGSELHVFQRLTFCDGEIWFGKSERMGTAFENKKQIVKKNDAELSEI